MLFFANWPLYIDSKSPDKGTFGKFKKKYGTKVKYVEEINDNDEFFGKVRQQYARGDSGGRDLHVVTDWMSARMIRLGYVQKLDKSQLPNVQANLLDKLKHPDYDKNRDYGVPWQGIQAGIIYRKDKVKRPPKSVNDIFDPAYKGKTTMLTEMRDSVGLVMLGMGKDPETGSLDDMLAAVGEDRQGLEVGPDPPLHRQRVHQGHHQGRLLGHLRLVGRRRPAPGRQPEHRVRPARGGLHALQRHHADPGRRPARVHGREDDRLRLPAGDPGRRSPRSSTT